MGGGRRLLKENEKGREEREKTKPSGEDRTGPGEAADPRAAAPLRGREAPPARGSALPARTAPARGTAAPSRVAAGAGETQRSLSVPPLL